MEARYTTCLDIRPKCVNQLQNPKTHYLFQSAKHEKILKGVFQLMDTQGREFISADDVEEIFTGNTKEQLEAMILEIAPNGMLSWNDFKNLMMAPE